MSYLPLILVLYLWRRKPEVSRLPPERLTRAIISGARYVIHSPNMRTIMLRSLLTGMLGGSIFALLPLLVRVPARSLIGSFVFFVFPSVTMTRWYIHTSQCKRHRYPD